MQLSEIRIGDRHRKDLGDIDSLAASIKNLGLLQPVVVTPDGRLVAGHRRIEAVKLLGWSDIPAVAPTTLDSTVKLLQAEQDENTERKEFTPSEKAALADVLEPLEREEARKRQSELNRPQRASGEFPEAPRGNALDKIADAVGMSRKTLLHTREVVQKAKDEPEFFEPIRKEMDETGKVDPAYQAVQETEVIRQEAEAKGEALSPADVLALREIRKLERELDAGKNGAAPTDRPKRRPPKIDMGPRNEAQQAGRILVLLQMVATQTEMTGTEFRKLGEQFPGFLTGALEHTPKVRQLVDEIEGVTL